MSYVVAAVVICLFATPAMAQAPYLIGGVGADISRFDDLSVTDSHDLEIDGGSIASHLRVGAGIGEWWGVELEFVRPAGREVEQTQGSPFVNLPGFPAQPPSESFTLSLGPAPQYQVRVRRRNTTFSTLAWMRQDLTNRISLNYLGGIAFHRFTQQNTIVVINPGRIVAGVAPRPTSGKFVAYNSGPVAGIEARIRVTDHILLVPGARLHGFYGGWIFRPSVGIGWSF